MDYNFEVVIDIDKLNSRLYRKGFANIETIVMRAIDEAMDDIESQLIQRLKENISSEGLDGTNLASTIDIQRLSDGFSIRMGSDYAIFVEYGTGIVGEGKKHPNIGMIGWEYDVNEHGEKGWFYPTTESDPNPYKHVYNGILYGWTKGMPSRPFMYNTWLWGTQSITNIVNGYVNRAIKKWELSMK